VPAADAQRREVHYSGRVQGVGFRYTVRGLAAGFDVKGYVKNLPDGRVQLVLEGPPDEVQGLLNVIRAEMGRYVTSVDETRSPATGRFQGFEIRF
jgi:acylphosphatase